MMARLRSWWQKTSKPLGAVIVTVLVVLLALLVVIILGYRFNWPWTGFQRRTLYDWLQLLIIPAVLAVGGYLFNYTTTRAEQKSTQDRDKTERDIALDNQREAALQAYIDSMSELLLEKKLRESGDDDEVRTIARVRSLTVLPRLDGNRKASLLQFLHESGLIEKDRKIVDLDGADLRGANLIGDDLHGADLIGANLRGARLMATNLSIANLSGALLDDADLSYANLTGADLTHAEPVEADLRRANLSDSILTGAYLTGANLSEANLSRSDLRGAEVTTKQLEQAKSLQGATMPDGSIHD